MGMRRTPYAIAIEVDRCLTLSLSNAEFEIVAAFIAESEDYEQTGQNLINCGAEAVWYVIETSRKD
jgi:hypothetical protein